jgi:hypothetical protein
VYKEVEKLKNEGTSADIGPWCSLLLFTGVSVFPVKNMF